MLESMEKANENLAENIRHIMYTKGIETQKELAEKIGIAAAGLVRILKGEQIPGIYPFFAFFNNEYGYTVEELLNSRIAEVQLDNPANDIVDDVQRQKFIGVYQVYHYNTSPFKGRENKSAGESLAFGVLMIYKERGTGNYLCLAQFGLNQRELKERHGKVEKSSMENALTYLRSFHNTHTYTGKVEFSNGHAYLSLNCGDKDHAYVIVHRPNSTSSKYIGGLGSMVSVSKGREACPFLQVLGISRYNLDISEEEVARRLLMGYPSIKPGEEVRKLMKMLNAMYSQQMQLDPLIPRLELTDIHKEYLLRGEITKIITDIVEKNLFRGLKISPTDDDEWYHFVKHFDPRKR